MSRPSSVLLGTMIPTRRLEDRIRELCRSVLAGTPNEDIFDVLAQLQIAMGEHSRRIENNSAATVLGWPDFPCERREQSRRAM
jgi:hypothetical protein